MGFHDLTTHARKKLSRIQTIRGSARDGREKVNDPFSRTRRRSVDRSDQPNQLLRPQRGIPPEGRERCPAQHQNGGEGTLWSLRPLPQHPSPSDQFQSVFYLFLHLFLLGLGWKIQTTSTYSNTSDATGKLFDFVQFWHSIGFRSCNSWAGAGGIGFGSNALEHRTQNKTIMQHRWRWPWIFPGDRKKKLTQGGNCCLATSRGLGDRLWHAKTSMEK